MREPETSGGPAVRQVDAREQVRARVDLLRRTAIVVTVVSFAGLWDLVAHHTVGITARAGASAVRQSGGSAPGTSPSDSQGFFGSGNGGASGSAGAGGNGAGSVLGSGGS